MQKHSITLTEQLSAFAEAEVASGRFASISEVLRAALRKEAEHRAEADMLYERSQRAKAELAETGGRDPMEVLERIHARIDRQT